VLDRFRFRFQVLNVPNRAAAWAWLVILMSATVAMAGIARAQTSTPAKTAAPAKSAPAKTSSSKGTATTKPATTHATHKSGAAAAHAAAATPKTPAFFTGRPDSGAFRAMCDRELDLARQNLEKLLSIQGKRTIENTLVPYNQIMVHSDDAGQYSGLMQEVHPDSAFRATAEEVSQAVSKFQSDLSLNRAV